MQKAIASVCKEAYEQSLGFKIKAEKDVQQFRYAEGLSHIRIISGQARLQARFGVVSDNGYLRGVLL